MAQWQRAVGTDAYPIWDKCDDMLKTEGAIETYILYTK